MKGNINILSKQIEHILPKHKVYHRFAHPSINKYTKAYAVAAILCKKDQNQ